MNKRQYQVKQIEDRHRRLGTTRREFIAAGGVVAFGATAPAFLSHVAAQSPDDGRVLVVVELAGGNDGLNSVIPHADEAYRRARPKLGIAKSDTLEVTKEIGLHSSMDRFCRPVAAGAIRGVAGHRL